MSTHALVYKQPARMVESYADTCLCLLYDYGLGALRGIIFLLIVLFFVHMIVNYCLIIVLDIFVKYNVFIVSILLYILVESFCKRVVPQLKLEVTHYRNLHYY